MPLLKYRAQGMAFVRPFRFLMCCAQLYMTYCAQRAIAGFVLCGKYIAGFVLCGKYMSRLRLMPWQLSAVCEKMYFLSFKQFDTVEILETTSDELLKACGMKGGQVARIRLALRTMNDGVRLVVRIFHLLVLFL